MRRFLMRDNSGLTAFRVNRRLWRVILAAAVAPASAGATTSDLPTWPTNPNWQNLVPAPSSGDVRPVSVVRTHGSVTNAAALTTQGSGSTVLTATSGSPAIVVLDFGKEVRWIPLRHRLRHVGDPGHAGGGDQ
jgi:hypothetical protein